MRRERRLWLSIWAAPWAAGLLLGAMPAMSGTPAQAAASGASVPAQLVQEIRVARAGKTRPSGKPRGSTRVRRAPPPASVAQLAGLRTTEDPLNLASSVALVVDQETNEILFSKNADAVLPIASITKLMSAMIVIHSDAPMDEPVTITQADVDTEKGSSSRLRVGTTLSRGELLKLALMSSENRAAHALGRTNPGGMQVFVDAMNAKAQLLGMGSTHFVEPTGLSPDNRSSAQDLTLLVRAAYEHPLIRELSTTLEAHVAVGRHELRYGNTNALVRDPQWDIGLQKTGFIHEAGRCLVMQARLAGRKLIMVLLDGAGRYSRVGDAERLRDWLTGEPAAAALALQAR